MKAYILKGIGQLEYEDVPMPELQSGWALVQVEAAGICGSDIPRIFTTGTYHFPTIPGHEFAGIVVDVFDKQDSGWIGKRAGVFPLIPCTKCADCIDKRYEMCADYDYLGSRRDGGFAELAAVPVWNLMELPENMNMKEAAMLEPASVALHAVKRLELQDGDAVALFGLGTIGLLIVQWLHLLGIRQVYAVGHDPGHGLLMQKIVSKDYAYKNVERKQSVYGTEWMSHSYAATWILENTHGVGVAAAIDCIGTSESMRDCLECVKTEGQVLAVANPKGDMLLNKNIYWKILRKQIRMTGTWNSSFYHAAEDDWHVAAQACSAGKINLLDLVTHCLPFDKLLQGLDIARKHEEYHNKLMICRKLQ